VGVQLSVQSLRNSFVTHRRDHPTIPGPQDACAACVMGNSTQQWTRRYDLNARRRMGQAAIDDMELYRTHAVGPQAAPLAAARIPPREPLAHGAPCPGDPQEAPLTAACILPREPLAQEPASRQRPFRIRRQPSQDPDEISFDFEDEETDEEGGDEWESSSDDEQ
jgi:hypothetical protein